MELDDLGAEFRRKLREELERVADGSDVDAAVEAARESDEATSGVTGLAGIGEGVADVPARAIGAPVLRVVVLRADGQRLDLGTVPMKLAASGANGSASSTARTPAVTGPVERGSEDEHDIDETSGSPDLDIPDRHRARGIRGRRRQSRAVVPGEVVEGGRVCQREAEEDELTFGDKARWVMGAIRKDLGRAATAAHAGIAEVAAATQAEIAEAAARRQDRKEQAAAEVAAAEAYFDSLHPEVQSAVRGLWALSERRMMITNTFQIGEYRKTLNKHGFDIDADGYLVELPRRQQRPVEPPQQSPRRPQRPPEDQWPNRNPGYRTGPRP